MERTPVPDHLIQDTRHRPSATVKATEAQVGYLNALRDGKDLSQLAPEQIAWLRDADFTTVSKAKASDIIGTLKELPWAPKDIDREDWDSKRADNGGSYFPEISDGRYAIVDDGVLKFYSVKKGTHTTFVDVWASDARYPIKASNSKLSIIQAILADPDAGPRFGREIGRCYVCGRTLTDETSRALGIGPVCRGDE